MPDSPVNLRARLSALRVVPVRVATLVIVIHLPPTARSAHRLHSKETALEGNQLVFLEEEKFWASNVDSSELRIFEVLRNLGVLHRALIGPSALQDA